MHPAHAPYAYEPAEHAVPVVVVDVHAKPAGQFVHATWFALVVYEPTAQDMGPDVNDGHAEPAVHCVHAVCAPSEYRPVAQATGAADTVAHDMPEGHTVQLTAPVVEK